MTPHLLPVPSEDLDHILAHTLGIWEPMRNQRLFITGGTGFFGCWLVESFCRANDVLHLNATATVLTRSPDAFAAKAPHLANHPAIALLGGDVKDFAFPPGQFRFVIHAATESGSTLGRDDPLAMIDTIVTGTRRVLEFARAAGTKEFLLTSSGAVYGVQPSEMSHISEDFLGGPDPINASSGYGEAKRLAEHLCAIYSSRYGIAAKIARCFAFVGPHLPLDAHFAIGNFIRDGLRGGPIRIGGDGTPIRSYLYAADLAVWLWTILLRGQICRPYNVGSESSISIRELAETVAGVLSIPGVIDVAMSPIEGKLPSRYVPSTRTAQRGLGLRARIPLKEAISRTAAWARKHQIVRT